MADAVEGNANDHNLEGHPDEAGPNHRIISDGDDNDEENSEDDTESVHKDNQQDAHDAESSHHEAVANPEGAPQEQVLEAERSESVENQVVQVNVTNSGAFSPSGNQQAQIQQAQMQQAQMQHAQLQHAQMLSQGAFPYPHPTQSYHPYDHPLPYVHHPHFYPSVPPFGLPPPPQHMHHPPHFSSAFPLEGSNMNHSYSIPNNSPNVTSAAAMAHAYHEQAARMRDHAAAYANAAAGAAWVAAQIASAAAEFASSAGAAVGSTNINTDGMTCNKDISSTQQYRNVPPVVAKTANPVISPSLPPPHAMIPALHQPPPPLETGEWWDSSYYPDAPPTEQFQQQRRPKNTTTYARKNSERGHGSLDRESAQEKLTHPFTSSSDDVHERPSDFNRNHRKRMQRMVPENSPMAREIGLSGISQPQQRGKIRRRLRSDGDSSTTSSGSSFMVQGSNTGLGSHRRRSGNHHNKKKARSDESMLGKTAVAALFEWCSKRQITPNFVLEQPSPEEFDYLVFLDDVDPIHDSQSVKKWNGDDVEKEENTRVSAEGVSEWGRGRGRNKAVAKQEAARRALQALLPGVVFDDDTGILIELPSSSSPLAADRNPTTSNSLEELAPNLAKQLAIGRDSDKRGVSKQLQQPKRCLDIYPGTSTTSEDEDENTYYTSRGASVCSVLLHAMVQIDTARIPEAPSFTYHVAPPPPLLSNSQQHSAHLRRKGSSGKPLPAVRATRGSFTCTARVKVREYPNGDAPNDVLGESKYERKNSDKSGDDLLCDGSQEESVSKVATQCNTTNPSDFILSPAVSESVLEAVGIGSTKRESRHIASAKLLALLFPHCKDMVEVKAAAEAMRERYAAGKVLKQQQVVDSSFQRSDLDSDDGFADVRSSSRKPPVFAFASASDLSVPSEITARILGLLEPKDGLNAEENCEAKFSPVERINRSDTTASLWQRQVESRVECALQIFNDRDEEGRALPEELSADDVGRLVLRRSEPEDIPRIKKFNFFSTTLARTGKLCFESPKLVPLASRLGKKMSPGSLITAMKGFGIDESTSDSRGGGSRMWPCSSIVLLLCRAIAAFEDPPLGCAVLTLGFSVDKGCLLRLSQIACEKHLPIERFIDCLQNFAGCMKCTLETESVLDGQNVVVLSSADISAIIESHVSNGCASKQNVSTERSSLNDLGPEVFNGASSKLQSVKEESEVSDSSSNEKRAAKRASKPSKRSRFE